MSPSRHVLIVDDDTFLAETCALSLRRAGFRVTTAVRSIVDVAARRVDDEQLARAIEDARDAGLLTPRQLRACAEAVDAKAALQIERALGQAAAT